MLRLLFYVTLITSVLLCMLINIYKWKLLNWLVTLVCQFCPNITMRINKNKTKLSQTVLPRNNSLECNQLETTILFISTGYNSENLITICLNAELRQQSQKVAIRFSSVTDDVYRKVLMLFYL